MSDERDQQQADDPDEDVVTVSDPDDDGSVDDRWSHEQRLAIAALVAGHSREPHAIHMAAVTRIARDTPGRAYYLRQQAEGKTRKERCAR